MSRLNNIQNKTFRLTQISIFSSIATISRCFIKIAPHSSAFLPIITLASFVTDKDCGFLLGAFSIFMSNIFLGQGSWTPWQMVAAGILGYLSGAVFNSKKVKPSVTKLTVFYVFCLTFIYCPIMNLYSFLLIAKNVNINGIITYFTSCFIIDMFNSLYSAPFIYILYTPIIPNRITITVNISIKKPPRGRGLFSAPCCAYIFEAWRFRCRYRIQMKWRHPYIVPHDWPIIF